MTLMVFDWCIVVLDTARGQLKGCKTERLNNFGFRILICSFFLKRIPTLSPQVELSPALPKEPRVARWIEL